MNFAALLEIPAGQDAPQMLQSYENLQLELVIKYKTQR